MKCDYQILDHCHNEYFVELKGKDLPHAIEQLEASIKQLSDISRPTKKQALIVSSRYPANDTSVQRATAEFKKKYKAELLSKNIQMEILVK